MMMSPHRGVHHGTPLQEAVASFRDLVLDARDELGDEGYSWFIAIATQFIGLEAARIFIAEALRATREETDEWHEAA